MQEELRVFEYEHKDEQETPKYEAPKLEAYSPIQPALDIICITKH